MPKGVPQIMDITSIKSILHYLSVEILPSKFEKAQQPEPNTIQLCFRGVSNHHWIEVSWQGDFARIISIKQPERIGTESTLAKQLSYGLKYMALVNIVQEKYERVIRFEFAKKPGEEVTKYLIMELMGKHSNFFYLDKNLKIITAGKQIRANQSRFRTISTGSTYSSPPKNFKKEPSEKETFESWMETISLVPEKLKDCLMKNYQGVSPILTKQIEYFAGLKTNNLMNEDIENIEINNLKKIFQTWQIWVKSFNENQFKFSIFDNYFYAVWGPVGSKTKKEAFNLPAELENYYSYYLDVNKINLLFQKISSLIFKQTSLERKNLIHQQDLLGNSENFEIYKQKADNVFLNNNLTKGDIIYAEKLYRKSKKLKRAKNLILERVEIYEQKILRLNEYSIMLENLNYLNLESLKVKIPLLEELKAELIREFNIKEKHKNIRKKSINSKFSPIEFTSPDNLIIQVGRNTRQNELISFKYSKKGDLWFHAQESPGSHVVLKSSVKKPTLEDIQISADIASFFSKAKGNFKVPINLVKIKDLQKINKGGIGCVSFNKQEIIWGNPTRGEEYIKKNCQS